MKLKHTVLLLSLGLCLIIVYFSISFFDGGAQDAYSVFDYHPDDIHCPIPIFPEESVKNKIDYDFCQFEFPDWIYIRNNVALFNKTIYNDIGGFQCHFKRLKWNGDFQTLQDENWQPFSNGTYLGKSLLRVLCKGKGLFNYNEHYLFGFEEKQSKKDRSQTDPDFVIVGIDSMSRLAWKKFLPLSYEYIEKEMNDSSTIFKKVNVRGDGTTVNLLAILTGEDEAELYESRRNEPNARHVDDYPWIWKILKSKHYKTFFDDEDVRFGTFQYRLLGFLNQPTDYYGRTWRLIHEQQQVRSRPCLNRRNFFHFQLNSVENFFNTVSGPKFAFVWSSYFSHLMNENVQKLDVNLYNFLRLINDPSGVFQNTIFVLLSDHGHRFWSRNHLRGKYEERLPFLAVNIAKRITSKHGNLVTSMKSNENKLVTLYDIHEMFLSAVNNFSINSLRKSRKISIFDPELPHRSCDDVNVPAHWCVCLKWKPIDPNLPIALEVVHSVIDAINEYTEEYSDKCHRLTLHKLTRASVVEPSRDVVKFKHSDKDGRKGFMTDNTKIGSIHYRVTFQTKPGDAVFEATMNVEKTPNDRKLNVKISDIDRNNAYAKWIWCITSQMRDVRKFCLCK